MSSTKPSDTVSLSELEDALSYRLPMAVSEIRVFNKHDGYPICPRCHRTLDREYMQFCDRCGQNLMWTQFRNAKIHHYFFSRNYCERGESDGLLNTRKGKENKWIKMRKLSLIDFCRICRSCWYWCWPKGDRSYTDCQSAVHGTASARTPEWFVNKYHRIVGGSPMGKAAFWWFI